MVQGGSLFDSFILHLNFIMFVTVNIIRSPVKSIRSTHGFQGGCRDVMNNFTAGLVVTTMQEDNFPSRIIEKYSFSKELAP